MRVNKKYINLQWWRYATVPKLLNLRASIGFHRHIIEKTVEGVSFQFDIANPNAEVWYGRGSSDSSIEMRFVRDRMLTPGSNIIECGAHHGYTTILLANWVGPEGRVFALEPIPEYAEVIHRNISLNKIKNVCVLAEAVGATSGHIQFRPEKNAVLPTGKKSGGLDTRVTTLDDFCETRSFAPNLIKIDVEGFEIDVLRGARRVLASHPALQIEVHPHQIGNFNRTVEDLWRLIDFDAYELWYQSHDLADVVRIAGPILIPDRSHIYCIPKYAALTHVSYC